MNLQSLLSDPALQQRNALLELVIENMPCGLIVFDERLRHVASNARVREMVSLPHDLFEQPDAGLESLVTYLARRGDYGPGELSHQVAEQVRLVRSHSELELATPDGRVLQLCINHMASGWQVHALHDVTAQRAAELRMRSSEERLALALNVSGVGLWEFTPDDGMVYLSPSWQQIMGFAPEARTVPSSELLGMAVAGGAEPFHSELIDLLKGVSSHICVEHEAVKASGTRVWLQSEAQVAARDANGRALRVVGTTRNITQRKEQERALQAAADAAQSASRAKAEFLATMSHEIRTPLNGVIGLARVLEQSELPPREAGYVRLINSCAKSLLGMVNDVLDFSKIDAGQMVLEPTACDLQALVQEVSDVFSDRARSKGIGFSVDVKPCVPRWVTVDNHRLRQILLNLLGNALKFTADGGFSLTVTTGALARQRSLRFDVTDTGIGIAAEDQAKLFKRFSQVDASSTRRFQGSGLGLAISRDLAVLMGGDIRLSSAPGCGATFTLEIPMVEAAGEPAVAPEASSAGASDAILLVEDNPINQLVAEALLDKLGFSTVRVAENGEEAVRLCQEQPFAAVLMDCQMPVMDGFEATRRLRELGFDMPIIALTAGAVSDDRDRCLAAGMNDYLAKPIDAGLLGGALNFWLGASGSRPLVLT
ncbi:ATP-binding protein [Ramlibacter sp. AN1015]|uniref:ATP-binding protein n=1 Tax=Ramlibacter sp. AN1015 TaxID=3133428 RepID=UPI0030C055A0